jgi:hypothetical protein
LQQGPFGLRGLVVAAKIEGRVAEEFAVAALMTRV